MRESFDVPWWLWVLLVLVVVSVILGAIGRALQDKGRSVERHRE